MWSKMRVLSSHGEKEVLIFETICMSFAKRAGIQNANFGIRGSAKVLIPFFATFFQFFSLSCEKGGAFHSREGRKGSFQQLHTTVAVK